MVAVSVDGTSGTDDMFDIDVISFCDSMEVAMDSLLSKVSKFLDGN